MEGITYIVLAGGMSLRLGRDKVWERLGDENLLLRVVQRLLKGGGEVVVVTSADRPLPPELPVEIATDLYPDRGALGGLYTGLMASTTENNLAVACDMPFLNLELLNYIARMAQGFDAAVPRLGGFLEPLHAAYSRSCLRVIEPLVKLGKYPILEAYPELSIRYVEEEEIDRFDPEHLSFFNINTEADLEKARRLREKLG